MGNKIKKRLERMKRSKSGWKRRDVDSIYEHYGFINGKATKHDKYYHPDYPQLIAYLPRNRKVAEYVISHLIKNIDRLNQLKAMEIEDSEGEGVNDE